VNIEKIKIEGFRNLKYLCTELSPSLNYIVGENGQGKTNFLEALYITAFIKSFRPAKNSDLVEFTSENAHVDTRVHIANIENNLKIVINKKGKAVYINSKKCSSVYQFIGVLKPVIFSPEELGIVKGSPFQRRSVIDKSIFQTKHQYLKILHKYSHLVKGRNAILTSSTDIDILEEWTTLTVEAGAIIKNERYIYISRILPLINSYYKIISGDRERVSIQLDAVEQDIDCIKKDLTEKFDKNRKQELLKKTTLVGPHRDDIDFRIDGRPLKIYGSQGQQRSFILALKMAQLQDIYDNCHEYPILLLDDMTSELDDMRLTALMECLHKFQCQTFITATNRNFISEKKPADTKIFKVVNGNFH